MDPKGKRRYVPPQPDENTFKTQEEFLESLQTVPVESLADNNRKCHYCWKPYGDSDDGKENAEQPVRFRCGHTFGEKCMKEDLFRLPQSITTQLRPIEFESGSKGVKLGEAIERYIASNSISPTDESSGSESAHTENTHGSTLSSRTISGKLRQLIRDLRQKGSIDSFDEQWQSYLCSALALGERIIGVQLYENAMVVDIEGSIKSSFGSLLPFGFGPPGTGPLSSAVPLPYVPPPFEFQQMISQSSVNLGSSLPASLTEAIGLQPSISLQILHHGESPSTTLPTSLSDIPVQSNSSDTENISSAQPNSKESVEVIVKEKAYTDKVAALKEKRDEEIKARVEATCSAFAKALANLYADYQKAKSTLAAQECTSSPPSKRLKRSPASFDQAINAHATLHRQHVGSIHHEANTPYSSVYDMIDYSDDEDDEDEILTDEIVQVEEPEKGEQFIILSRQLCRTCCFKEKNERKAAIKAMIATKPSSVSWKAERKTTNLCPICSKVLFHTGEP